MNNGRASSAVWLFVGAIATAFCCTWIDPYLTIGSPPLAQCVNAVVPVLLFVILWGAFGRPLLAISLSVATISLFVLIDRFKFRFLGNNLVYADLTVVSSFLQDPGLVAGFVRIALWKALLLAAGFIVVMAALAVAPWGYCRSWRLRVPVTLLGGVGLAVVLLGRSGIVVPSVHWEVFMQPFGASRVGVVGNILLGERTTGRVKTPVDPKAVAMFRNAPEVKAKLAAIRKNATAQVLPDIVVVQSESLFVASQLCELSDTPVLANIEAGQRGKSGGLDVPVFGGGTLQTEFEVLTGAPIKFFRGSMFAYYEMVDHPMDAWPRQLSALGYRTIAMHPGARAFWRRGTVFPLLGFDAFVDETAYAPEDLDPRGRVTDAALMKSVISELDSSGRPSLIFAITIANHGPWGAGVPDHSEVASLMPATLPDAARASLGDYLSRSIDADQSWRLLKEALSKRARPAIAVIYGDHLPGLPRVYEHLCFKDGRPPVDHVPPVQVWANFAVPDLPALSHAYLLGGWLSKAANLSGDRALEEHVAAAAISGDPAIAADRKKTLLGAYDNVAAENVYTHTPSDRRTEVRAIDIARSTQYLTRLSSFAPPSGRLSVEEGGLVVSEGHNASTIKRIPLKKRVAGMTFRLNTSSTVPVHVQMIGDNKLLLDTWVTDSLVNMATIDVGGVESLTIQSFSQSDDAKVVLKTVQLQCWDRECGLSGEPTAEPARENTTGSNLDYLMSHVKDKKDGLVPIKRIGGNALFIHSSTKHLAWFEFEASNISSITLSPSIEELDSTCKAISGAGNVNFTVSGDGETLKQLAVGPGYNGDIALQLKNVRRLRLIVDSDGDSRCDWFSVKVRSLTLEHHKEKAWWDFGF